MTGFKRYFSAEPSRATLRAIEGVSLIERPPAAIPDGVGTGVVCLVGEFEDGPMDSPTEVRKKIDLLTTFGGFGYVKDGKPYQNPVARRSGGSEDWNGNGYLALRGKKFNRLIITRVNTSAGKVKFRRLATLTASERGPHDLEPSDTFEIERDGTPLTATVNAAAGTIQASGGIFPTTFVGGEYLLIEDEYGNIRKVTFAATDQAIGQVITAINAQLAYTAASNNAGQILLTSRVRGSTGYIKITGGTASAITQLGFTTTDTAEVDSVTVAVASTGVYTFTVAVWTAGVVTTYTGTYTATVPPDTVTVIRDALLSDFNTQNPDAPVTLATSGADTINITSDVAGVGITTAITATPNPGDFTTANVTPNSTSFGLGTGNVADVDRVSDTELVALIDALSGISAVLLTTGYIRLSNTTTPESGTLEITGGAVATSLGFTVGDSSSAGDGEEITIPAGTRIEDTAGNYWVTLESYETDTTGGPWELDVRPATDDDTTPSTAGGTATTLVDILDDGFAVTNDAALTRLSPAQIDAAYRRAIESTAKADGVSLEINIIVAARTSASIIQSLISNVEQTRAEEFALRVAIYSPPIGTSLNDILTSATIGVRAAGNRSTVFCRGPGVLVPIPEIEELGAEGGTGFNDAGIIEQHFDVWYASIRSILPPEENAGQDLSRTVYGRLPILGLEEIFNSAYGGTALSSSDYIALKAAGVGAPKMGKNGCEIMSDVTCLPEASDPERSQANYRFMFDYIGDSCRELAAPYVKTLVKPANTGGALTNIQGFLESLKSEGDPDAARILDFSVADETLDENAAKGDRDIQVDVKLLQTNKYFNIGLTVGTSVTINNANA